MKLTKKIAQKIDQADSKTLIILSVGATVIVILLVLVVGTIINRSQPDYNETYTDKDTGEVVSSFPNVTPETEGQDSDVLVLGLSELNKFGVAGLVPNQLPLIRQDLLTKALPKLGASDKIIKITNAAFDFDADQTTATLKLSETRSLKLVIKVKPAISFNYTVSDGGTVLYTSDTIYSDDYTGDGSPPQEQPDYVNP